MKSFLFLPLLLLLIRPAFAADASAPYYVPPSQMNAALKVMENGYANIFALFQSATGSFRFDDTNKSISDMRIALDTASLLTTNAASRRGLADLLGAFQYPEIRITAPDSVAFADNKAQIKATVTLHGVSKTVTFDAVLNRVGKTTQTGSMWSGEGQAVGLSLQGTLNRADFGLADNPEMPSPFGGMLTLILEIQAIRQ